MNIMRIYRFALAAALMATTFTACSDDENGDIYFVEDYYPYSTVTLTENTSSDVQSVTHTQVYQFDNGLLTAVENRQHYSMFYWGNGDESEDLVQTTNVVRDGNTVTMTDSYDNVSVYTLNSDGLASGCVRTETSGAVRNYEFSYVKVNGLPMLSSITESIDGESFSSIALTYSGTTMHIVRSISGETLQYTADLSADGSVENNAQLPSLFLAEMHPLSLHQPALYGRLIGYPASRIGGTVTPDDTQYKESTVYKYSVDEDGNPVSCDVKNTSQGTSYTRYISVALKY
jgi:hypothetical protein